MQMHWEKAKQAFIEQNTKQASTEKKEQASIHWEKKKQAEIKSEKEASKHSLRKKKASWN
jgi:hypothetical protein